MGWISDRKMKTGRGVGGKRKDKTYPKEGAPLRKVVGVLRHSNSIFVPDLVELECGHQADSWGGVRARCPACKPPEQS